MLLCGHRKGLARGIQENPKEDPGTHKHTITEVPSQEGRARGGRGSGSHVPGEAGGELKEKSFPWGRSSKR